MIASAARSSALRQLASQSGSTTWAGADGPLATGIELERKAYSLLRATHDFAEGVDAFVNKRKPEFTGS